MKELEQEVQKNEEPKRVRRDPIQVALVGGALLTGIYLLSHPEYIEAAKNYLTRFWH